MPSCKEALLGSLIRAQKDPFFVGFARPRINALPFDAFASKRDA